MVGDSGPAEVADLIERGLLVVNDGYRAKNSELADHGLPFARGGNIAGGFDFEDADRFPEESLYRVGEKVSEPGDVVFTSKGTVGRFAFVVEDTPRFVYSPQLCFWRSLDHSVIYPRWLFYWMHGGEFFGQYSGVKGQTDMADYVSLSDQRRMLITLPPIEEQRRIAEILGTLDDKINLNHRTNRAVEVPAAMAG
jgi:type I restriction enzyme S subunit